jgi:hypothetical protein
VGDFDEAREGTEVQFRYLSEEGDWEDADQSDTGFRIPLREAGALAGNFLIVASTWPDETTKDAMLE